MIPWILLLIFVGFAGSQSSNLPPRFLPGGDMRSFALREDVPVGTAVYTLKGQDPEGTPVTFSISGDYLSVDRDTGVVVLVKKLDREVVSSIETIITVTDSRIFGQESNTIPRRLDIQILDVNDNPPVFQESPYTFQVSESTPLGTTLFSDITVLDADAGINSDVTLSCVKENSPDACEVFNVQEAKIEEGKFLGIISLSAPLDYEKKNKYKLELKAIDGGGLSSTTFIDVFIGDVQDHPPVLLNAPYSATVEENSPKGQDVLTILARDGDSTALQPIKLSIEGDEEGFFELAGIEVFEDGSVSAKLVTSSVPLDRETPVIAQNSGIYYFYIKAEETEGNGEWSRSKVAIVVSDRNDQNPVFSAEEIRVSVSENVDDGTPLPGLDVIAFDNDIGENAEFTLHLENVKGVIQADRVFDVFPKRVLGRAPVIIKVKNASALDFEDSSLKSYICKVTAKQRGQPGSSILIHIDVVDSNDNKPIFGSSSYSFSVHENAKSGHSVGTLKATDRDSGKYGEITYSIKGFGAEKFLIDSSTGEVSVAGCGSPRETSCLDYEQQAFYALSCTATDGGGHISFVSVTINILDVNDNPPVFDLVEYRRVVDEGALRFVPPLYVVATDVDGKDQGGGTVSYEINGDNTVDGAFGIDRKTGEITINRPLSHLDTPSSIYTLTVRATDAGSPPLWTDVRVLVRVGKDKNRPPRFLKRVYYTNLPEHAEAGTSVLTVKARDPDGVDSAITYDLRSGGADHFVLNPKTGVITVTQGAVLDREAFDHFSLVVTAVDAGQETRQSSTALVNITLTDINNKPPVFLEKSYSGYVSERSSKGYPVLRVQASDPDLNSKLSYLMANPVFAYDKTGFKLRENSSYKFKNAFEVNKTTGEVVVSGSLSHDAASVIVFTILVKDENSDPLFSRQNDTTEVTIYIQAYSDENPIFPTPWSPAKPFVLVSLNEESPLDEYIFSVAAEDPISKRPVRRYEKVKGSDPGDLFFVDPITGQVSLKKRLDYEISETKEERFDIMAIADERSSRATVIVTIKDINDHSPVFERKEYSVRIPENSQWPISVVRVLATDKDSGSNGQIYYKLTGEYRDFFTINKTSGLIQVAPNVELDREETPVLNLEVSALDTPTGGPSQRQSTIIVRVDLLDVNDEKPHWMHGGHYAAVVPENAPIGSTVVKVEAVDRDLGDNGVVYYEIPELQPLDGLFKVEAVSGVVSVAASLNGKGRTAPYELTVRAVDRGTPPQFSEVLVVLYIGDVSSNDGVPRFIVPGVNETTAQVMENSPMGTAVLQVKAVDPDGSDSPEGRLHYSFLESTRGSIPFRINPTTGLITTKGILDREEVPQYHLVVLAQDMGRIPQVASKTLVVNVMDVDDNEPEFLKLMGKGRVELYVEEEAAAGTVVGIVKAHDADVNAMIDYKIMDGNEENLLAIRRTKSNEGQIIVKGRIDREKVDKIELIVACGKLGQRFRDNRPYRRSDKQLTKVLVTVKDLDDNRPVFDKREYVVGVKIDAPLLTEVVRLTAIDADPTSEAIHYSLYNVSLAHFDENNKVNLKRSLNESKGVFLLEETTGVLRTSSSLEFFSGDVFVIYVGASSTPTYEPTLVRVMVYVLRDSQMLRFVFNKNPLQVRNFLPRFQEGVSGALPVSGTLNIYEANYYNDPEGNVNYDKTSSCFQLVGRTLEDTKKLLDQSTNGPLRKVFTEFGVERLESCQNFSDETRIDWVEIWVLVIAALIGLGALIASVSVCLLYSSYKRKIAKNLQRIRLLDNPKVIMGSPTPSLPQYTSPHQGSVVMLPTPPRMLPTVGCERGVVGAPNQFEWREMSLPVENASYASVNR